MAQYKQMLAGNWELSRETEEDIAAIFDAMVLVSEKIDPDAGDFFYKKTDSDVVWFEGGCEHSLNEDDWKQISTVCGLQEYFVKEIVENFILEDM